MSSDVDLGAESLKPPIDPRAISIVQIVAGLDPATGGPPVSAVATAIALRRQGLKNSLAFPVERGSEAAIVDLVGMLRKSGVIVHIFRESSVLGSPGRRWGASPRLAIWLLRNGSRYDVFHMHSSWTFTTVIGLLLAKMHRRIAVLSTHESLTDFDRKKSGPTRRVVKLLLRWVYMRSFDLVVVASVLEQTDMGDHGGRRSVVVPHAVIGPLGRISRSSNGGELRVGFLGRLHPKKNLEAMIDALALLPDHVGLRVAGDGPEAYRASLISRAIDRRVHERIDWLGFVDSRTKSEFFASIDVLVMPSEFECFGVAGVEALGAGVPVIVSSRVGIADIVQVYCCGRVISPAAEELAQTLLDLMETKVREQLSENACLASREYSVEAHGDRMRTEYEAALSGRSTWRAV